MTVGTFTRIPCPVQAPAGHRSSVNEPSANEYSIYQAVCAHSEPTDTLGPRVGALWRGRIRGALPETHKRQRERRPEQSLQISQNGPKRERACEAEEKKRKTSLPVSCCVWRRQWGARRTWQWPQHQLAQSAPRSSSPQHLIYTQTYPRTLIGQSAKEKWCIEY